MPAPVSPSPPRPSRRRGRIAALVCATVLGAAAIGWFHGRDRSVAAVAPLAGAPAQQAGTPAPPGQRALPGSGGEGLEDGAADGLQSATANVEPRLISPDTDLSYARRAGLHRTPNPLRLTASVALAVAADNGEVLYARNERAVLPIASLTKLLTGIVLLDSGVALSEPIRITGEDVDTLRHSRSRLPEGTVLTRAHALQLALMSSENRAAHALARTYPGGVPAFVAQMNRTAARLGMAHSRFADPAGLSSESRATARDVATLVLAASRYPLLREGSTTKRHLATFGRRRLQYLNSNRLVQQGAWPIQLQKTGYIVEAGQCLALLTQVRGRPVVLVLMDAGSVTTRSADAGKLRRWVEGRLDAAAGTVRAAPAGRRR